MGAGEDQRHCHETSRQMRARHPDENTRNPSAGLLLLCSGVLARNAAGPIPPTEVWNENSLPFELKAGEQEIFAVIDPEGRLPEPDKTSIRVSRKIGSTSAESSPAPLPKDDQRKRD